MVDGVSLPDTPLNIRQSGSYNKVPEMIGFTEDEYSAYLPYGKCTHIKYNLDLNFVSILK